MNGYAKTDWKLFQEELKDAVCQANCLVYMYTRSYLAWLCNNLRECENVDLKAFILAPDNISCIIIIKGTLAEYPQVGMLLRALLVEERANVAMKYKLDPGDPLMFEYNNHQKHVVSNGVTTNALAFLNLEEAHTPLGFSPWSVPAGVPLQQMAGVVNNQAIASEEIMVPAQATEELHIATATNTIFRKMDSMIKAFKVWTIQMSKANELICGGYQTDRE